MLDRETLTEAYERFPVTPGFVRGRYVEDINTSAREGYLVGYLAGMAKRPNDGFLLPQESTCIDCGSSRITDPADDADGMTDCLACGAAFVRGVAVPEPWLNED